LNSNKYKFSWLHNQNVTNQHIERSLHAEHPTAQRHFVIQNPVRLPRKYQPRNRMESDIHFGPKRQQIGPNTRPIRDGSSSERDYGIPNTSR